VSTPVIPGFYPDPSICRVGDAYYTAHSSFEYAPGVPIFRSTDLVTWTQIGNALTRSAQLPPSAGAANSGIYAPTIRYAEGRYWVVTTNIGEIRRGHLLVSAEDPAGPWSDGVHVAGTMGIDPDLSWDEDGVCRLTWASFDPACPGIVTARFDPGAGRLLEEPRRLWPGTGMASAEGPHLYRVDGWWYLLLAEGGTERGHTVTMARAHALDGPWEAAPGNPILTHRSTGSSVQNVGHADLVQLADGTWAAVYHGVRPRGISPHFHVNGRETFVAGVDWVDGWPVLDEERFAVPAADTSFVDRFDEEELHPRWISPGVAPSAFCAPDSGGLVLRAGDVPAGGSALLAVRTRDEEWTFDARLRADGEARVLLRIDADRWYGVDCGPDGLVATVAIGPAVSVVGRLPRPSSGEVSVRISALRAPGGGFGSPDQPDLIELAATVDSAGEHVFGQYDGRYLSTEVAGGFTGRVVGVQAVTGAVLLREVGYRGGEEGQSQAGGSRYDLSTVRLEVLLADPEARAVLEELLPEIVAHPFLEHMKSSPLDTLLGASGSLAGPVSEQVRERLQALASR
jgi:hypothetical protein